MRAGFGISAKLMTLAGMAVVVMLTMSSAFAAERVPLPHPAKGKGEACVAETDFMRRNHPKMLKHQRDDTLRLGIRGDKFSLKGCVACHAVLGPDAKPVTIKSPEHFCRECHDYAAVQIDCFECHNSVPDDQRRASINFKMPLANDNRRTDIKLDQCRPEGAG